MRCVANDTSFCLHRSMFEDKRSCLVGMAAEANLILSRSGSKLARQESAMGIMAIAARHKAFIHAMVYGLGELRLDFKMAAVTEHRLGHGQQRTFYFGMMRRMAVNAADVILQVLGA